MTEKPPSELVDWTGAKWTPNCGHPAAHPNSRYTVPASQCPVIDPEWENPNGVPISAFIFGSKRSDSYPLVVEAATWEQGIFLASTIATESDGKQKEINRQPFAMHPFLGYNINDYLRHWLEFRTQLGYNIPKIFVVNWFRRDEKGEYLWPGYNENSRILKWIHERTTNSISHPIHNTILGLVPDVSALDLRGVDIDLHNMDLNLRVDRSEMEKEMQSVKKYYEELGPQCPTALWDEFHKVVEALKHM